MIELTNVTVAYGENVVYKDFSCRFDAGVNVVLGKSGCGKTTLLNVISDLVPYVGQCKSDGDVAVVLQQPCLAPVSVWKNVDLVLPKGDNKQKIDDVLQRARIFDKRNSNAKELSGGEQQRVALARAFATERNVLLFDEPFSNLDYGVKQQLQHLLDELLQNKSQTVVLVTQDIDEAIALADRIYLLQDKPCTLTKIAEIDAQRSKRSEYEQSSLELKKQLQNLLK